MMNLNYMRHWTTLWVSYEWCKVGRYCMVIATTTPKAPLYRELGMVHGNHAATHGSQ